MTRVPLIRVQSVAFHEVHGIVSSGQIHDDFHIGFLKARTARVCGTEWTIEARSVAMITVLDDPAVSARSDCTSAARLGPEANGIVMSPDEFDSWDNEDCDPGFRYELIRGVLVVNPIAAEGEASPNDQLGAWLRAYQQQHPQGAALDETLPQRYVHLSDGSRRLADRVLWCGLGRRPDPKTDVPRIAVEFVSRRRRDWRRDNVEKRQEYRDVGVQEYWVIDRFRRQMTVFFGDGTERVVAEEDVYESPLLPGFRLALESLLRIADRWSDTN